MAQSKAVRLRHRLLAAGSALATFAMSFVVVTLAGVVPADAATQPVPVATLSVPAAPFLGSAVTIGVTFDNASPDLTGYGPYVDVLLPTAGADGNDGLTYVSATYSSTQMTVTRITCTGANVVHPLTGLSVTCPAGKERDVVQFPFGSFSPAQPATTVQLNATLSSLADVGTALAVTATAGFMYGADPTGASGAIVSGSPATGSLTPQIATLTKTDNSPEGETATGPNYLRSYTITADVAAGQTASNLTVTDRLPSDVVFVSATPSPAAATTVNGPGTGVPHTGTAADLTVSFGAVVGTGSASDATVVVSYWVYSSFAGIPPVTPTTGPDTGSSTTDTNQANGTYGWTPTDARDLPVSGVALTSGTVTRTNEPLTLRKSVTNLTRPGGKNLPGDTLRYTLRLDVSDYHSVGNVRIPTEYISDGQTLDPSTLKFAWYDGRGTVASSDVPVADYALSSDPTCVNSAYPGATRVDVDLSAAATTVGATSGTVDGHLVGGRVGADTGPAGATVTFDTRIDGKFSCQHPTFSSDLNVNQGDLVLNHADATADLLNLAGAATGGSVSNATSTQVVIGQGGITKSVYAINGSTTLPSPLRITVGDTVTYRFTQALLTGNFEDLALTDYLPQPMFHAAQMTTPFDPVSTGVPAAGMAQYGPADTLHSAGGAPTPALTTGATDNSLVFTYGTYSVPGSATSVTSDLLFTVTVAGNPFVDGLFITNQVASVQQNTQGAIAVASNVVMLTMAEPLVSLRKGVVVTNHAGVTYSPSPPIPAAVSFTPATALHTGVVASSTMGTTAYTSSATGFDAGDTVTFAVTAENVGHGAHGAYNLRLHDTCPTGFDCTTPTAFTVTNGAGTDLSHTGLASDFFTPSGITLAVPLPACASYLADNVTCNDATGANVAVIAYSLKVSSTVVPLTTMTNTATVDFYSNTDTVDEFGNAPRNFVPVDAKPDNAATFVTTTDVTIAKALLSSSQSTTTGSNLTIGEIATYELTLTVPEGELPAAKIVDTLVTNSGRLIEGTVVSVVCAPGITDANGVCGIPSRVTLTATALTANFGTVTNANTTNSANQTIVITYTAVVADIPANHGAPVVTNGNSAVLTYTGPTGATVTDTATASTTVVEPVLTVTKSVDHPTADAGDLVTFTLTVKNALASANNDAFNAALSDVLPAVFTAPSVPTTSGGCPSGAVAWTGNTLAGTWGSFPHSTTCVITFTATFGGAGTVVNTSVTNTTNLTWASLPTGGRTSYTASGAAAVQAKATVAKLRTGTDLADTAGANVAIGETVDYAVTVALPEGMVQTGFTVTDTLPAGMRMVPASTTYDFTGFAGTLPGSGLPGAVTVTEPPGAGGTLRWAWTGDTTVPATNGSTSNKFVIHYKATVIDVVGNSLGKGLQNSVVVQMTGGTVSTASTATVTVALPVIAATKTFNVPKAAVGDPVTVTLTVTNTGTGPLYDATLADPLPATLDFGSFTTTSTHGYGLTSVLGDRNLTFAGGTLQPGETDTIVFTATVNSTATAGQVISNTMTTDGDTWLGSANADQRPASALRQTATATFTVTAPDVAVTKTDSAITAAPNQTLTYDVVVSNVGDRTATGVTAADVVPANTTFVSSNATGTCPAGSLTAGTVSWNVGTLTPAQSVHCALVVRVDTPLLASVTNIVNQATAAGDNMHGPDRNPANNLATDTDGVVGGPALVITKSDSVASVVPGDTVTYTVTVTNTGPIEATSTQVTDPMPPNTTLVSATGSPTGVAVGGNGTLTWNVGSLVGLGGTATHTVTVQLAGTVPAGVGNLSNTATVSATNATSSAATDDDAVDAAPDLSVTKDDSRVTVRAGDAYDYTLVVSNKGNQGATGLTVTDTVPAGLSVTNAHGGTVLGNTVTWTVGGLAAGATSTLTLSVAVASPVPVGMEQVKNTVVVADNGANGADPTPGDNTTSDTDTVVAAPALDVTKSDGLTAALPGATLTYTVRVTNAGDQNTTAATAVDTLPANTSFVSATGSPTVGGGTLTWSGVRVDVGTPAVFTVRVRVDATVPAGADHVVNTVTVTDPEGTAPSWVTATDSDILTAAPDLTVTKTDGRVTVNPGDGFDYTIVVRNVGTQDATGVRATDTLPAGLHVTDAHGGTIAADTVTWDMVSLAAGASRTFTLTVALDRSVGDSLAQITNAVTVADDTANGPDPTPADNTDADTDAVNAAAVLTITKTDGEAVVKPGDTLTYTVVVTNTGDRAAAAVQLTDAMPVHTTLVSATGSPSPTGVAVGGNGTLTWDLATLAGDGGTATRTVTVAVDNPVPAGLDELVNTATASSTNAARVSASDIDALDAAPDLAITKKDGRTTVVAGDVYDYTLHVANNGNQDATGVVVTDTLPPGLTCLAHLAPGSHTAAGTCDNSTHTAAFATQLAAGAGADFVLTVQVDNPVAAGVESVANTAVVADDGTNGTDPKPAENTDIDTDTVGATPTITVSKDDGASATTPGATLTYTVTVTNTGTQHTATATVVDALPAHTSFMSATGSPTQSGSTLTWTHVSVSVGVPTTFTIKVTVDQAIPAGVSSVHNSVTVTDPEGTTAEGVSATDMDTLDAAPDLAVTKTNGVTNLSPGDTTTYSITVTNNGNQDATGVMVHDAIRATFDRSSVTYTGGAAYDPSMGGVAWPVGDLAVGATQTLTVTGTLRDPLPAGTTEISNTASANDDGTNGPDTTSDNAATDTDPVGDSDLPDLLVTKDDGRAALTPGHATTYDVTVSNVGNVDTTDVVVTDTVPAHMTVTDADGGTVAGGTITWTIPALAGGAPAGTGSVVTFHPELMLAGTVPAGLDQLTNTVVVADGAGGDVTDTKNTAADTDTVDAAPDLSVTKTDGVTTTRAGGTLNYTLTVTNIGNQDATGVMLTDTLEPNLTLVDAGTATATGSVLTWPGFGLVVGQTSTFTVEVTVNRPLPAGTAMVSNTASAVDDASNGPDLDAADNTATDADAVGVDLSVSKTNGVTATIAGSSTTWRITVTNKGPGTLHALALAETTPTGISDAMTYAPTDGTYEPVTGAWSGLSLAQADSVTLSVTGQVDPGFTGDLTNTVTVAPVGLPEIDPTDNTASDTDLASAAVDVGLTKSHPSGRLRPGDPVTWTLAATNAGPSAASNATVTDTLPAGVSHARVDAAGGWACGLTGSTLSCVASSLSPGYAGRVATVTAEVAAVEGNIDNTATVTSAGVETDPTNNTSADPGPVTPLFDLAVSKKLLSHDTQPGAGLRYAITVTNHGPSPFRDVLRVIDTPRAGLRLASAAGRGWQCTAVNSKGAISCVTGADLLSRQVSRTITVRAVVTGSAGQTLRNSAAVLAHGDTVVANNVAVAMTKIAKAGPGRTDDSVPTPADDPASANAGLPHTGFDPRWLMAGLLLIAAGSALLTVRRRRA